MGTDTSSATREVFERRFRGRSSQACSLRNGLAKVAPLDSTVLLTGETGTGKGHAARAVHEASPRASKPFVHVDCAALAPTLIESELFGHEKGAFTNAGSRRVGRFEWAADGTVFLDEIGDLDLRLQSKLLRVLDDRAYERLGGTHTLTMRARVIAATSHDLIASVRQGRFRSDLYFRLQVFHFRVPPLRERLEDLPGLVSEGIARVCKRLGVASPVVTEEFLASLRSHDWPGNVRELLNSLERAVVASENGRLRVEDLDSAFELWHLPGAANHELRTPRATSWSLRALRYEVEDDECREIVIALEASRGNVARAARRLRIPRSTLRHRITRYNLEDALADDQSVIEVREADEPER